MRVPLELTVELAAEGGGQYACLLVGNQVVFSERIATDWSATIEDATRLIGERLGRALEHDHYVEEPF